MNNSLFCLVLILTLASCATVHNSAPVLYQEFSRYENGVNTNNIIEVASIFFSPSLLGKNYQVNPDAISQLLFKNYMVTTHSHHETMNMQEGCLTINGYDEESSPLIFSLKYISSNGHWLIDKIHVVFIEDEKDFANRAKCPSEYPN